MGAEIWSLVVLLARLGSVCDSTCFCERILPEPHQRRPNLRRAVDSRLWTRSAFAFARRSRLCNREAAEVEVAVADQGFRFVVDAVISSVGKGLSMLCLPTSR